MTDDPDVYFLLSEAGVGCHAAAFWLGAAAITLIFGFLGFLASRLPLCSPLAMSIFSLEIIVETFDSVSLVFAERGEPQVK